MPEAPEEEKELEEPPSVTRVSDVSENQERSMYGGAHPEQPNSLFIPLGKLGHLSWQSESGTPVLALIMLVVILICLVMVSLISIFTMSGAASNAASALGQALLALVGAVLGASGLSRRQ
jgi:hypothetical protein